MPGIGDAVDRNVKDVTSVAFWKAVVAEVIGTAILVFCGCAVCLGDWEKGEKDGAPSYVQISLTFGLAVATPVWCIAHVSGGHINPAVTVAMLVTRKITLIRAIFYVVAQCSGAILGAGLVWAIHPHGKRGNLGATTINTITEVSATVNPLSVTTADPSGGQDKISPGVGFMIELLITFVLVFTVFASCDKGRSDLGGSVPLTIGLSVTLCHLFAIKYTGSSMNPARTFGPAVVGGTWKYHYIYWLGPITGGVIAGLLYDWVFAVDASIKKIAAHFTPDGHGSYSPAAASADPKSGMRMAEI